MNKYDFNGRLTKLFPSQIIVEVTNVCNFKCVHCPQAKVAMQKGFKGIWLDQKLNNKIVDEVKKYSLGSTQQIRYTANGEPLLHPNILEMLEYSVKNSGTFVSLTTNGSLLTNEVRKKLLEMNIGLIDISIDAYTEMTYSLIRKNGDFKTTVDNVTNLLKEKAELNSKTRLVVSFVEQDLNINETEDFKSFWEEKGIDFVVIRRLHTAAGMQKIEDETVNKTCEDRYPCVYPWERIILTASGYLSYCPNCWEGSSEIANYQDVTINELWNGDYYNILRQAHLNNNLDNFKFCKQCTDWKQTRWPEQGRGYGDMISDFNKTKK